MKETKQQRWNRKNPEKLKIARERSSTKHFISNYATNDELDELRELINQREDDNRDQLENRLSNIRACIRRHSGPKASKYWHWGRGAGMADRDVDVFANAEVYPYQFKGQFYAVALFDDRICVGLPQYARFRPKAQQVFDMPMPLYYNHQYERQDWPVVRALLEAKYGFRELVRVRYAIDSFVEVVGNEYFYPISGWPMLTISKDDRTQFSTDLKTKTRVIGSLGPEDLENFNDDLIGRSPHLESTIEKSVWDKLTPKQKDAFVPISNETVYPAGYYPLSEKAKSDSDN